jgi:hypothetical protein
MIYWEFFLAFFIPNIIGYGGGPAIIHLIELKASVPLTPLILGVVLGDNLER